MGLFLCPFLRGDQNINNIKTIQIKRRTKE